MGGKFDIRALLSLFLNSMCNSAFLYFPFDWYCRNCKFVDHLHHCPCCCFRNLLACIVNLDLFKSDILAILKQLTAEIRLHRRWWRCSRRIWLQSRWMRMCFDWWQWTEKTCSAKIVVVWWYGHVYYTFNEIPKHLNLCTDAKILISENRLFDAQKIQLGQSQHRSRRYVMSSSLWSDVFH